MSHRPIASQKEITRSEAPHRSKTPNRNRPKTPTRKTGNDGPSLKKEISLREISPIQTIDSSRKNPRSVSPVRKERDHSVSTNKSVSSAKTSLHNFATPARKEEHAIKNPGADDFDKKKGCTKSALLTPPRQSSRTPSPIDVDPAIMALRNKYDIKGGCGGVVTQPERTSSPEEPDNGSIDPAIMALRSKFAIMTPVVKSSEVEKIEELVLPYEPMAIPDVEPSLATDIPDLSTWGEKNMSALTASVEKNREASDTKTAKHEAVKAEQAPQKTVVAVEAQEVEKFEETTHRKSQDNITFDQKARTSPVESNKIEQRTRTTASATNNRSEHKASKTGQPSRDSSANIYGDNDHKSKKANEENNHYEQKSRSSVVSANNVEQKSSKPLETVKTSSKTSKSNTESVQRIPDHKTAKPEKKREENNNQARGRSASRKRKEEPRTKQSEEHEDEDDFEDMPLADEYPDSEVDESEMPEYGRRVLQAWQVLELNKFYKEGKKFPVGCAIKELANRMKLDYVEIELWLEARRRITYDKYCKAGKDEAAMQFYYDSCVNAEGFRLEQPAVKTKSFFTLETYEAMQEKMREKEKLHPALQISQTDFKEINADGDRVEMKIKNIGLSDVVYQIRQTNNRDYRVSPAVAILNSGDEITATIVRSAGSPASDRMRIEYGINPKGVIDPKEGSKKAKMVERINIKLNAVIPLKLAK